MLKFEYNKVEIDQNVDISVKGGDWLNFNAKVGINQIPLMLCIIKQRDLIMHAHQDSGRAYPC